MKTKTVSFSLVAIKFPFGLQNYWKKNFLIPLIGLNWSVCFNNFFCWVTREVLFQQSGKHKVQKYKVQSTKKIFAQGKIKWKKIHARKLILKNIHAMA